MKRLVLIFCMDGNAGKALAETIRNDDTTAQLRSADGVDLHFRIEDCDSVVIMPDVPGWKRRVLQKVYDGFVLPDSGPISRPTAFSLSEPPKRGPGRPRKDAA